MRFLLCYFCINPHNSCLSKTHPIEILPVLTCKWKIHCLSGLHQHLLPHAFFTPLLNWTCQAARLSHPLTSFPLCRALAAHVLVPGMLVHHNLKEQDSLKLWAVPPRRNVKAIACLCSILGKSVYHEGFIKGQNQGHLCSPWADPNTLLFGTLSWGNDDYSNTESTFPHLWGVVLNFGKLTYWISHFLPCNHSQIKKKIPLTSLLKNLPPWTSFTALIQSNHSLTWQIFLMSRKE